MRKQIIGVAAVLVLAAGVSSSATAFDQRPGSGSHAARARAGGMHGIGARHGSRFEGVRGFESWRERGWSHGSARDQGDFIDLGPLGITARCGSYNYGPGYCGQGYSVSAWSR